MKCLLFKISSNDALKEIKDNRCFYVKLMNYASGFVHYFSEELQLNPAIHCWIEHDKEKYGCSLRMQSAIKKIQEKCKHTWEKIKQFYY